MTSVDNGEEDNVFVKHVKGAVKSYVFKKYTRKMPFRLVDTYTGFVRESTEIAKLLYARGEYKKLVEAAASEAERAAATGDSADPDLSERPDFQRFDAFAAQFLAFAMFSHRWRDPGEPTYDDVKGKSIYTLDQPSGVRKLQEFCCTAAKCGYRWAWSDTCCINSKDFADRSESINSMFLWYSNSDLTIVFLDDVKRVRAGIIRSTSSRSWFRDPEIRGAVGPPQPLPPKEPTPLSNTLETKKITPILSLHDRILNEKYSPLLSMQPDSQIETHQLEEHLNDYFWSVEESKHTGRFPKRKLPEWVTRGWTLQEMLASKRLRFYSREWTLLGEGDDRVTEEAAAQIFISSFKCRAELTDHRTQYPWKVALERATGVPKEELANFKVGARNVRSRLRWAAKRETTKIEDTAYSLLGIFDVSLPAMYGEGPRAFLRLQEEIMKRTGDDSFDWCGQSSSVNSFLALDPQCYLTPDLPEPIIDDSNESIFHMIVSLLRDILGAVNMAWSEMKAWIYTVNDWIKGIMKTPPPGHTLVNGELHVTMFEHQVRYCERLKSSKPGDRHHYYKLEADWLVDTKVVLTSDDPGLMESPTEYYLCRTWHRYNEYIFQILLEFIGYIMQDMWNAVWDFVVGGQAPEVRDEADVPGSRLREEMQAKRKAVMAFFQFPFPVYLVRVRDGLGVRVCTENRVETVYKTFDFTTPVVTRAVL